MKGQMALEFMIVISVGLLLLVPIAFYGFSSYNDNVKVSLATNAVSAITNNVDKIYSFGPGSETTVTLTMPDGINLNKTNIAGKVATIGVQLSNGGTTEITSRSKTLMIGYLPNSSGIFKVKLRDLRNGSVQVGEILRGTPNVINKVISPNNPEIFTLSNEAPSTFGNVNNITLVAEGRVADIINNLSPNSIFSLPPSTDIRINFKNSVPSGTYDGMIFVNSSNGGEVQVYLNVTL